MLWNVCFFLSLVKISAIFNVLIKNLVSDQKNEQIILFVAMNIAIYRNSMPRVEN